MAGNNIIGPFQQEDWNLLRFFRTDIREMVNSKDGDYSIAISKQKSLYHDILNEYRH